MSTFKVEVVNIGGIIPHPNADRLDIVQINDWQCVAPKGQFKIGDACIYFPIDSILPQKIEEKIFGLDAKVRLTNSRVKTIKLRGAVSQGLAVPPTVVGLQPPYALGYDYAKGLGVTKYEAPATLTPNSGKASVSKRNSNPNFRKYTGIENAKNYPKVFEDGEEVVITEKIHGTNFRAGWVPFAADTLWKKIKAKLGLAPKFEFVYGSHNVQLQNSIIHKGYYGSTAGNVYAEAVLKYDLKTKLAPGEVVYGEVYGDGIQKGYTYGCRKGERKLILFDVMVNSVYKDPIDFKKWAEARLLPVVPHLFTGPFSKDTVVRLRDGDSVLAKEQKVREGVVVKSIKETSCFMGRKMLKYISDAYLLKNQDNETVAH